MSDKSNQQTIEAAFRGAKAEAYEVVGAGLYTTNKDYARNFPEVVSELAKLVKDHCSSELEVCDGYKLDLAKDIKTVTKAFKNIPADWIGELYSVSDYTEIFKAYDVFNQIAPGSYMKMKQMFDSKLGLPTNSTFSEKKVNNQSTKNCQEILPPELDT